MFNLPGKSFRQLITSTSSIPTTLNYVIVYVRQFVIALVSVDGCSGFPDPDGFLDMPDSSVGFLVYYFHFLQRRKLYLIHCLHWFVLARVE